MLTNLARKIEPRPPRDRDQIEDIVLALLIISILVLSMPVLFHLDAI